MKYIVQAEISPEVGDEMEAHPERIQEWMQKWQALNPIGMYFGLTRRVTTIIVDVSDEDAMFEALHSTWVLTKSYPNIWPVGDATEFHIEADGYVMVDFLHHIPVQQQNRLLSRLHALLTPGGFVVILEVPDRPFIKAMLSRISDWILYPFDIKAQFRNPDEFIGILEHIGFHVLTFERPTGIFAGIGYACRKSSETGSL